MRSHASWTFGLFDFLILVDAPQLDLLDPAGDGIEGKLAPGPIAAKHAAKLGATQTQVAEAKGNVGIIGIKFGQQPGTG